MYVYIYIYAYSSITIKYKQTWNLDFNTYLKHFFDWCHFMNSRRIGRWVQEEKSGIGISILDTTFKASTYFFIVFLFY